MSEPRGLFLVRVPSALYDRAPFYVTIVALLLAPFVAAIGPGTYLPFLVLRLWMVGFAIYGVILARRAGGIRRSWQAVYLAVAVIFAFVWGLDVEQWAPIDWAIAGLVALSMLSLSTEPIGSLSTNEEWMRYFVEETRRAEGAVGREDSHKWVAECARRATERYRQARRSA